MICARAPQVSVAVLLDNFIRASAQMEKEEQEHQTEVLLRESLSMCVYVGGFGCVRARARVGLVYKFVGDRA